VTLLIAGVSLGTLAATKILGNPFDYAWVTVAHKDAENNSTEVEWSSEDLAQYGVSVAHPVGYDLFLYYGISQQQPSQSDTLVLSPSLLSDAPTDGPARLAYSFQNNATENDLSSAIEAARDQMTQVTMSTETYHEIEWTKLMGTQDVFGSPAAGVVYVAYVPSAISSTTGVVITARLAGADNENNLLHVLDETVQRTTLLK
jgi:hypothetical protein